MVYGLPLNWKLEPIKKSFRTPGIELSWAFSPTTPWIKDFYPKIAVFLPFDTDSSFFFAADLAGYDSEIYANDQLVTNGKYQPRSPPNSRYLGSKVIHKSFLLKHGFYVRIHVKAFRLKFFEFSYTHILFLSILTYHFKFYFQCISTWIQ